MAKKSPIQLDITLAGGCPVDQLRWPAVQLPLAGVYDPLECAFTHHRGGTPYFGVKRLYPWVVLRIVTHQALL